VLAGVGRHWLTGHYRSRTLLSYLVLPMSVGSVLGAIVGGYVAALAPTDILRIILAIVLGISAIKLLSKQKAH
jgi:uncharacterized membrane protein YfcA